MDATHRPKPNSPPYWMEPLVTAASTYRPYGARPSLASTRKHRSLEGQQFLSDYEGEQMAMREASVRMMQHQQPLVGTPLSTYGGLRGTHPDGYFTTGRMPTLGQASYGADTSPYSQSAPPPAPPPPPPPLPHHQMPFPPVDPAPQFDYRDTQHHHHHSAHMLPTPLRSTPQRRHSGYVPAMEYEQLKHEYAALNDKLNYVMNSIRTFWSPELKQERQQRKEEAYNLQHKLCQQAVGIEAEIQMIRNELEKREKDISQLLTNEPDMMDVEEELRRLRKQLREPRDFTDTSLSVHEFQTMKSKMEQSEVELVEKTRELQELQLRLKNVSDQNTELGKRNDALSQSSLVNEGQAKLLQEDLETLRLKLESKNQQLEGKEKIIKRLESGLDAERSKSAELAQTIADGEHKISRLTHRLDQLESLLGERDAQIDSLKQRLLQHPDKRTEAELLQRLENGEQDKQKLEEVISQLRQSSEIEKQDQVRNRGFHAFQEEAKQLNSTITNLQKELDDRLMLIGSQNEKISQLDYLQKNANGGGKRVKESPSDAAQELDVARKEIERLLRIIKSLERRGGDVDLPDAAHKGGAGSNESQRIKELEEALQESLGITTERDKQIAEHKKLIEQLSAQIGDLYKGTQQQLNRETLQGIRAKTEELQKQLGEERLKHQQQMSTARKEIAMAVIREKEACLHLLQGPPDSLRDKIDILLRQKEQLKHQLLSFHETATSFSTVEGGPYLGNVWQQYQQVPQAAPAAHATGMHYPSFPINVAIPPPHHGIGRSAPASFSNYAMFPGQMDDGTDDGGIWA